MANSDVQRRCVIIGGAEIRDYNFIKGFLRDRDYYMVCDCGLNHLDGLGILPDLIIGDFDSHENPRANVETIVLPHEKDVTDTAFAAEEALRRGFRDVLLIGAVGGRLDHSLVNVSILLLLDNAGCRAQLLDDYSLMEIAGSDPTYIDRSFGYFSLLNLFGSARKITITGALYNVENAEITADRQYATSNEVASASGIPWDEAKADACACVTVGEGKLLLIRVCREQSDYRSQQ